MADIAKKVRNKSYESQLRYLSQSVRLEEVVHPRLVRMTIFSISFTVIAFLTWTAMTNINEVARAPGEVAPQGFQQIVQHFDGGIIKDIKVTEGQTVEQGQVLLVLDGAGAQQDLDRAQGQQTTYLMQEERLRAFVENRTPDFLSIKGETPDKIAEQKKIFAAMMESQAQEGKIIEDQIAQKEHSSQILQSQQQIVDKNYALAQNMYGRRNELHKNGYLSDIALLQAEQDMNNLRGQKEQTQKQIEGAASEMNEYQGRLQSLGARYRDDAWKQLDQVESQLTQNAETIEKLQERVSRLEIKAPVRGIIKGMTVNTIGGVVEPGQKLMEIVPLDKPLVVDLRIPPQYIGPMKIGQPVQVKLSSYDFSRYGSVPGKLEFISATTFEGERGERFYQGRVRLDRAYAGHQPGVNIVMPGMTVMADIITGHKTILEYLLKPIHRSLLTAFSER